MIVTEAYKNKTVGVFGLARSGLDTAESLQAGGANVWAWDDNAASRARTKAPLVNLYEADLSTLDSLVMAPGVPLTHPVPHALVVKAKAAQVEIIGDMEIFQSARPSIPAHKLVAITGTNGKSTTTALLAHVLNEAGRKAVAGGNIGIPILGLKPLEQGGVYVFEVSSFQIDLMKSFNADIAILLNITPDHIDRHGSLEGYVSSKSKLFTLQSHDQLAIIGVDDVHGQNLADKLAQRTIPISIERAVAGGVYVLAGKLYDAIEGGDPIMVGSLAHCQALRGDHNGQNAAAVYAACRHLGVDAQTILEAYESFAGLRHRLQVVAELNGALFVDDSKASNTDAATKALRAYDNIHWIVGGRLKEKDISILLSVLSGVKHAYLVGEAADIFAKLLAGKVPFSRSGTIKNAVAEARQNISAGDVVLLAPACASFDQYTDFEARGRDFVAAAASVGARIIIEQEGDIS